MINNEFISIIEIENIENNKHFQRLSEKTQVLVPMTGRSEIAKTRLTHSYEVATSAKVIASYIAIYNNLNSIYEVDYNNCLKQISLLHDIGHPPLGHDGASIIDKKFKELGLSEGFSDNNNNLTIIEKDDINLRDYVKASTIKYPDSLYEYQKEKYSFILSKAINEDKEYFENKKIKIDNINKTISCQIMDEADRNSYTCSDLSDFFCLNKKGNNLSIKDIESFFNFRNNEQFLIGKEMISAVNSNSKKTIKEFFIKMKNNFNKNLNISNNGLYFIDKNLFEVRESFSNIEYELFIKPIRQKKFHLDNINKLNYFIDNVVNHNWIQSSYYKEKLNKSTNEIETLRLKRDMISEVSDWFVINFKNKNKPNSILR